MEAIEHFVENDGSHELFLRPFFQPGLWLQESLSEKGKTKPWWGYHFFFRKKTCLFQSFRFPPNMDVSHFPGRSPTRFSLAWMKPLGLVLLGAAGATYLLRKWETPRHVEAGSLLGWHKFDRPWNLHTSCEFWGSFHDYFLPNWADVMMAFLAPSQFWFFAWLRKNRFQCMSPFLGAKFCIDSW